MLCLNFPQAKKEVVDALLKWIDGLESRRDGKPVVVVTCLKMCEDPVVWQPESE